MEIYSGESVRWKTSRRQWLGPREGWLSLIAMTDEATGRTLARLTREDSVQENLQTLRSYVTTWGRPLHVRTDRSTLFGCAGGRTLEGSTYGGRHIRRALVELKIEWLPAETPPPSGHSALFFAAARERFLSELTSARVRTFEGAARYLESVYLPKWNGAVTSRSGCDRHRPLLAAQNLESIFSVVELRKISRDHTIRFNRTLYRIADIDASTDLAGGEIQVEKRADGKVVARWNGRHLGLKRVEKQDVPRRKRSAPAPRKPRAWNKTWMNGFFNRLRVPIWKLSR
jgi:hypothetical protein